MNTITVNYAPTLPMAPTVQTIGWQDNAVNDIVNRLDKVSGRGKGYLGVILRGSTGLGKMYITAKAIRVMHDLKLLRPIPDSINPFLALWLCPKSLKVQTQRCLKEHGIAHLVMVMTYGQIKNKDGLDMFLQFDSIVLPNGQPALRAHWLEHMLPSLVVCDEIQKFKNWDTTIADVIANIPDSVQWIGMSATPWQRVSDSKVHLVRCGVVTGKYNSLPCTINIVNSLAREIAHPKNPDDYSPSSVQRLREAISDYIVELKNVRFKFPTKTSCESISFRSAEERQIYITAYEEYLRELWEIKRIRKVHNGVIRKWVAMQKFQQKAEFIRCGEIAERALQRIKEGKQVIVASNYVETLRQVWRILRSLGFDESRIAFVVGNQTENIRQQNVDKFQEGRADIMLFTMRSGGVGLSMHHDRPTTRPRHIILPPTWSAIDLVQALGRGHRLTSLSPTTQEILWYKGTVEDRVKEVVQNKVKCISKSVTAKEQFITLFERTTEEDMEINEEENDELNETIIEQRQQETVEDVDGSGSGEEEVSGEGLDSVDELPTTYQ